MTYHYWHRYWPKVAGMAAAILAGLFYLDSSWAGAIIYTVVSVGYLAYGLFRWTIVDCMPCWRQEYFKSLPTSARQGRKWNDL